MEKTVSQGSDVVEARGRPFKTAAFIAYRVLWVVLFVGAIVSVSYGGLTSELATQRQQKAGFALGLSPYLQPSAEGMLLGPLGKEGSRIGFREGDLLLAVDGKRLPSEDDARVAALTGPAGDAVRLTVRHQDGIIRTIGVVRDPYRLQRSMADWGIDYEVRRWTAFAIFLIAWSASLLTALLLFLRRPREKVAQLLSFSLVLGLAPGVDLQYSLATIVLTLAVLLFATRRISTGWQWLALASVLIGEACRSLMIYGFLSSSWFPLVAAIPPAALLLAVMQQLRVTPTGIARQQIKSVLFGITAFCVLRLANSALVYLQAHVDDLALGSWIILFSHLTFALSALAIPAGLLISLFRFRLYDAETAISRSVAFGALTLILLAIFAASGKIIEALGERFLGAEMGAWSGALGAAIAAVITVPVHGRVTRWAERRFQGDLFRLRRSLPALVADLRETADPQALGHATLARLGTGVRAAHGAVTANGLVIASRGVEPDTVTDWLRHAGEAPGDHDRLHADRGDPLFPLRVPLYADGVGLAGWLLLGPRPDGSFYGKDERETLMEIADPVARALAISSRRHSEETARASAFDRLTQRLTDLETLFDRLVASRTPIGSAVT
ncbi:hypothetical protein [Sphingomonas rubra]|uniref:hypothetical protein n=1 Tax=Sphingomonas rubra TaxID=634430 RepID=UPI000B83803A